MVPRRVFSHLPSSDILVPVQQVVPFALDIPFDWQICFGKINQNDSYKRNDSLIDISCRSTADNEWLYFMTNGRSLAKISSRRRICPHWSMILIRNRISRCVCGMVIHTCWFAVFSDFKNVLSTSEKADPNDTRFFSIPVKCAVLSRTSRTIDPSVRTSKAKLLDRSTYKMHPCVVY